MGIALAFSRFYVPGAVKSANLRLLFAATADAFGCAEPDLQGLSYEQRLREYALFTKNNAEKAAGRETVSRVKAELYGGAVDIGQKLRRQLGLKTFPEFARACETVYRAIAIECRVGPGGEVEIPGCYFSQFYTGEVCRIVSSLDEGLIAGLSGGLKLEFSQRITDGYGCCRAAIRQLGKPR